jgi:biotin transporter BioY
MNLMEKLIKQWLANPWVIKFVIAILGLAAIKLVVGALRFSIPDYAKDPQARYRVRKLITQTGYLLMLLFLAIVFKDKLGGLTVVLGFTGAGGYCLLYLRTGKSPAAGGAADRSVRPYRRKDPAVFQKVII